MKIAYVFAYLGDGGTEDHAILLAKKAKESGCEPFFIVSSYSEAGIQKLKAGNIRFYDLPMRSSFNPLSVMRSVIGLKRIIKQEGVDIVHAHMLREQSLAILVKIIGGKFVLIRTFHRLNQFNWKMKLLMPIYLKFTDAVISISSTMSGLLEANGWGNSYTLIKNGVAKVDAPKHDRAIGFIGRLSTEKGILKFIEANIELLRKNKLIIAGTGPDFNAIKKITDDNKLNIELLGNVLDKASFYKKISILLLPSDHEVLPLVILEAYSCGLPVVAFDIKPLLELVDKENGILVKFPDYAQMGREVLRLLPISSRYYKSNINTYESKYSDDIMWSKTYKLYQSKLNRQ